MTRWTQCLGVVLAAGAVACGRGRDESAEFDTAAASEGAVIDTAAGAVAAPDPKVTLTATLSEWKIELPADTVRPGKYTFQVVNDGRYSHAFEVEGEAKEWETARLEPGQRAELTIDLGPGTYQLYCPVEDAHGSHVNLGMRRTLVVRQ